MSQITIRRKYSTDDMRAIWDFCKQDFERYLELLVWLDSLNKDDAAIQVTAAKDIWNSKKGKSA